MVILTPPFKIILVSIWIVTSHVSSAKVFLHPLRCQDKVTNIKETHYNNYKLWRNLYPNQWLNDLSPVRRCRSWLKLINPRKYTLSEQRATILMTTGKHHMYLTCFSIVFTWIALGTLFYSFYNQWPLPQSFFYAVDAGMSIGFCTDVVEPNVTSRAFTVVYILLGASCVGGALALMVQTILDEAAHRSARVYKQILEKDYFTKAFNEDKKLVPSIRNIMLFNYQNGVSRINGVMSYDSFRSGLEINGCILSDDEFQKVCKVFDPHQNGFIEYGDFIRTFQGTDKILNTLHYSGRSLPLRFCSQAYSIIASLFTDENKRIYLILITWIGVGIVWGMIHQGWDMITATHFAVSALATGGLTAPPVDENGILPAGAAIFCGLYCIFGIPLFALTLSQFARVLVESYIMEEELSAITRPLTRSEFQFASKSLCSTDNVIHLSDFIVLQLFRQGKLSLESLEFMKRQFQTLDKNQSGRLNWNEATISAN